jgi:hypothetical protein
MSIWAVSMANPLPAADDPVRMALRKSYRNLTSNFEMAVDVAISWVGLRTNGSLTSAQLSTAISTLAEGCAIRDRLASQDIRGIFLPSAHGDGLESWTIFGIGLEALCEHFLEEIPDWESSSMEQ